MLSPPACREADDKATAPNWTVPERSDSSPLWPEDIKLKSAGKFRFTLHASNHEVILSSQSYEPLAAAEAGIASVQANSPTTEVKPA